MKKRIPLARQKSIAGIAFISPFLIGLILVFVPSLFKAFTFSINELKISPSGYSLNFAGLKFYKLNQSGVRTLKVQCSNEGVQIIIKTDFIMAASATYPHLYGKACWKVCAYGRIVLSVHCRIGEAITFDDNSYGSWRHIANPIPHLPKFGLRFVMSKEFYNIKYFGMGPVESYCDENLANYMGIFEANPEKEFVDYIRPQECSNHYNTVWGSVDNGCYGIIIENVDRTFDFSAIPYASQELSNCRHNFELPVSDKTVVSVDYMNSGIGSGSCGPQLKKSARLDDDKFD